MKILTEDEFLKLPEGTLYRNYELWKSRDKYIANDRIISPIFIKMSDPDDYPDCFYEVELGDFDDKYMALHVDNWKNYYYPGEKYEINESATRGHAGENHLFIVYEHDDILVLKKYIDNIITSLGGKDVKTI